MVTQTLNNTKTKVQYLPYNKGYEEHYISAAKMFIDYPIFELEPIPFVFNHKNQNIILKFMILTHPHHFYLQALAELGIIGFYS